MAAPIEFYFDFSSPYGYLGAQRIDEIGAKHGREVARFNEDHGEMPVTLKLGLHEGPCIAVTLNGRLDYFGTTVNMAARLQSRSRGGDIVVSAELAADPAVAARLADLSAAKEQAELKGFDSSVEFLRLQP